MFGGSTAAAVGSAAARVGSYTVLDAYARLISIIVNHGGENMNDVPSKVCLRLFCDILHPIDIPRGL
ncbi:unnamed protein product [Dibothriocephalus latus]|uniref:Uncharacterized protein n=1 Tax=Dibothriocephalus latus TaxID=60516 RepID=A0A3P6QS46_DIBLA|nr:unnamed protein product [Dibothriocephalus latus]